MLPGTTPPQKPQSTKRCPSAAGAFGVECGPGRGRGNAVEGHVDEGRDPARRRRARGAREALPLGASRLVDVDVGVHEARHHDPRSEIAAGAAGRHIARRDHVQDPLPGHEHCRRAQAFSGQDARAFDREVRKAVHSRAL